MTWDPSKHARAPKGASGGGEFTTSSSSSSSSSGKRSAARRSVPKGSLGYDGKTGTGYGSKGGDARVKRLQAALNKLGIKDAQGRPLAVDGKLGPKTTAAIQAWQKRNGMKPTGTLTAADLKKATAHRSKTSHLPRSKKAGSSSAGGS